MDDSSAPRFGLPKCLWIPIAAKNIGAIEQFVGKITGKRVNQAGRVNAILVETKPYNVLENSRVKLWKHPQADLYRARLYPARQVWVHVDYSSYRKAYIKFCMPDIPSEYFLDHIQNREAIRLRDYSHPFLRLCPVSRIVNTSGGGVRGGEGLEKEFLRSLKEKPSYIWQDFLKKLQYPIVYADPMDLTKMLNIPPGTETLNGVRDIQTLFYESEVLP